MQTYHIYINGVVQGIGFSHRILKTAQEKDIRGWVSNTRNGIHIRFNTENNEQANLFYEAVLKHAPQDAIITDKRLLLSNHPEPFEHFSIIVTNRVIAPDTYITSDKGVCPNCKKEMLDPQNRHYHYPFTSCRVCGPRYSIQTGFPYERDNTTLYHDMCPECEKEYETEGSRFTAQILSCKDCPVNLYLFNTEGLLIRDQTEEVLDITSQQLSCGSLVAVKGDGGFKLLGDPLRSPVLSKLSRMSGRLSLLFEDLLQAKNHLQLGTKESVLLQQNNPPILRTGHSFPYDTKQIAKESRTNITLPDSALLFLIAHNFGNPLIMMDTDADGHPIYFEQDDKAVKELSGEVDYVVTHDRILTMPLTQDYLDCSIPQITIPISRGSATAPSFPLTDLPPSTDNLLSLGSRFREDFAFQKGSKVFISQDMGKKNPDSPLRSVYCDTITHFMKLYETYPEVLIMEKGTILEDRFLRSFKKAETIKTYFAPQGGYAHLASVLAENQLLNSKEPFFGAYWNFHREAIKTPQTYLFEDQHFTEQTDSRDTAFPYGLLLKAAQMLQGSSSLHPLMMIEQLMELSQKADEEHKNTFYDCPFNEEEVLWREISNDLVKAVRPDNIARKLINTLADDLFRQSEQLHQNQIIAAGSLFNNASFRTILKERKPAGTRIYFNQRLNAGDSAVGLGHLALYHLKLLVPA